ncbi:uncharacterized protein [Henckelia pumila]|uniref:uncharacterized protein n=1 Tax=Henckelia pumila TaxID=405737 RepID=UPI003C6E124F
MQRFDLEFVTREVSVKLATLTLQSNLRDRICEGQLTDAQLLPWRQRYVERESSLYTVEDGIVRYRGRLWVPVDDTLRQKVMTEAHRSLYYIHPGSTKMYKDLQRLYWWPAHFLPVKTTYSMSNYAELYLKDIVRLHGIPVSIVSDRDPWFTSGFWRSLHHALGTRLNFSTTFHPQTDEQSERVIHTLEDLLRACVLDFQGSWDVK